MRDPGPLVAQVVVLEDGNHEEVGVDFARFSGRKVTAVFCAPSASPVGRL